MEAAVGHIVVSLAGRDKERPFYVLKTEDNFVYLADGKLRKLEACKRKNRRHVRVVSDEITIVSEKLRSGKEVLNSGMRKALSVYLKTRSQAEGGNLLG
ncbi:MAG: KOW domain-containing RNA-binding protein [Oscillospiraceae bacterium]|nr:KOW domain-containing RNA-binding protein [Oscillospiraceae bacterium]